MSDNMEHCSKILIALILYLSISISGCISNDNTSDLGQEGEYIVTITSATNDEYSIVVPIVVEQNGSVSNVMNNILISEGRGTFNIQEFDKGFGLEINSSSSISIVSKIDKHSGRDDIIFDVLSLEKYTDYNGDVDVTAEVCYFYILLNSTNINSSFDIQVTFTGSQSSKYSGGDVYNKCSGNIEMSDNWQLIEGYRFVEMWDKR